MVVHAGIEATLAIIAEGVGGHGENGHVLPVGQLANGAGGFKAIHQRHLHVHQHGFVATLTGHVQGLLAVVGKVYGEANRFEQAAGNFLVDQVVLCQQNRHAGCPLRQQLVGMRLGAGAGNGHGALPEAQPGGKPESAALPGFAAHPDVAAHQASQPMTNGQPQTGTAEGARGRAVGLLEGIEEPWQHIGSNADPTVLNLETQEQRTRVVFRHGGANDDLALLGELDGVADIVDEDLPQSQRVSAQHGRHRGVDFPDQRQPFFRELGAHQGGDVIKDVCCLEIGLFQRDLVGLDLRDIENVIDD